MEPGSPDSDAMVQLRRFEFQRVWTVGPMASGVVMFGCRCYTRSYTALRCSEMGDVLPITALPTPGL